MGIETIKKYPGTTIGTIETSSNGDKTVRSFNGTILGYYRRSQNATVDFRGTILYYGDMSAALLILK